MRALLKKAGVIACLFVFAGCAEVALMSVTPMVAAIARHFDQGTAKAILEMEQKKDWVGLLALAQAQLQVAPDKPAWWVLQGYALARQGEHAAAADSYRRALRLSPEDENSWLALGQSQSELRRYDEAAQTYRQALRYRPESAQAYLALAELYMRQGQPDRALPNYRESVRYEPELEEGWRGLAAAYDATGQPDRRDEALKALHKLNPAAAERFEKQLASKLPR